MINLSTVISGHYGLNEVALSLPVLVSDQGVTQVLEVNMNEEEKSKFLHSASVIKKAIDESNY